MKRVVVSREAVAAYIPAEGFFPADAWDGGECAAVLEWIVRDYMAQAGGIRRRAREEEWPAGMAPAVFAALNRALKARLWDLYEGRVDTVGLLGARMRERGYDPGEWVARDRRVAGMLLGYWSFERTKSPFFIFRLFERVEPYCPGAADLPYRGDSSGLAWEYICSRRRRDAGR